MANELVSFKGMGDGVKIILDPTAAMHIILDELELKITESKAFFGGGDCRITFGGRKLTGGEKMRLEELIKRLLPLCRIVFETSNKKKPSNDWIIEYKEKHSASIGGEREDDIHENPVKAPEKPPETEEEFLSVFRSNRARFYNGFVHDGMTIRSDGHLILLGEVEPGGSVIAVGNVIVIGGLYGTAHAGCNGHIGSYILAMDMKPEKLMIADKTEVYKYEEIKETHKEPEVDAKKRRLFARNHKKEDDEADSSETLKKNTFSAVALWKNTKIEVNIFTIEAFTNTTNYGII
jgi:septum site-determining protein MinC